jgi:hypothetical protein
VKRRKQRWKERNRGRQKREEKREMPFFTLMAGDKSICFCFRPPS